MKNGSNTRLAKIACKKMFRVGTEQFQTPLGAVIKVTTTLTHEKQPLELKDVFMPSIMYEMWGLKLGLHLLGETTTIFNAIVDMLVVLDTEYLPSNIIACESALIDRPDGEQDRKDDYKNYCLTWEQQEEIMTAVKNRITAEYFPENALLLVSGALN